jgi:hypothetical protein
LGQSRYLQELKTIININHYYSIDDPRLKARPPGDAIRAVAVSHGEYWGPELSCIQASTLLFIIFGSKIKVEIS